MHPVLQLMNDRAERNSRPGSRDDGHKLGLVIQGGGMRGVVSAGMVTALESAGRLNDFDAVYGSSAGAINGAFFVAGQAALGTTIYHENINNGRFIRRSRLLLGRPVVSLEFLLDHVMVKEKPLDWQRVIDSPVPLKAVASSLRRARSTLLDSFRSRRDLFDALRASARIPLFGGPPVQIGDDRYLDAVVFESIPHESAIRDGCSHVLVLLTVPWRLARVAPGPVDRFLVAAYLRRVAPGFDLPYLERFERYTGDLARLRERSLRPADPPFVLAIGPPEGSAPMRTTEKRRAALVRGAEAGIAAVRGLLEAVRARR